MTLTEKHLCLAIARWHGWFDSRPNAVQRAHNPGALTHAPSRFVQRGEYVVRHGRTFWRGEHDERLVIFQCGGEGFAALENVLRSAWSRGESLIDYLMEHAPRSTPTICAWLGIDRPNARLRDLVDVDWPLIPGAWKNFPPPGEPPRWPLDAGYLATLGCERDDIEHMVALRGERRRSPCVF